MKYLLILITITIVGCNNSRPKSILIKDTVAKVEVEDKHEPLVVIPDTFHLTKKKYSYKDNNTDLLKDLPHSVWDTVYMKMHLIDESYFTIDNNIFKIRPVLNNDESKTSYDATMMLEKRINTRWKKNIEFIRGRGLFFEDANLDGYPDLFIRDHRSYRVYLYLPQKKKFASNCVYLETQNEILDVKDKIFYSIENAQTVARSSYLYQFKEDSLFTFYMFRCEHDEMGDSIFKAKEVKLYKCKRGDPEKKAFLKKLYPVDQFASDDSVPFWRKNWKRLIKEY